MLVKEQYNVERVPMIDRGECNVCRDLLANLRQFFGMLEGACKPPDSEWMTAEEVAQELKISRSIVYRIIRSGDLAAVDIVDSNGHVARKGHYRIRRSSLKEYLESKQVKAPQKQPLQSCPRRYAKVKNHLGL